MVNKPLIRKIRKHILEEPRRYNQQVWREEVSRRVSPCGTQACIGGWAETLSGEFNARVALGLTSPQADALLGMGGGWPNPYREQFYDAKNYKARAEVAGRLLNAIIRTDGKILES